jgi:hypothetical protein
MGSLLVERKQLRLREPKGEHLSIASWMMVDMDEKDTGLPVLDEMN